MSPAGVLFATFAVLMLLGYQHCKWGKGFPKVSYSVHNESVVYIYVCLVIEDV